MLNGQCTLHTADKYVSEQTLSGSVYCARRPRLSAGARAQVVRERQAAPFSRADAVLWADEEEVDAWRGAALAAVDAAARAPPLMTALMYAADRAAAAAAAASAQARLACPTRFWRRSLGACVRLSPADAPSSIRSVCLLSRHACMHEFS